MPIFALLGSLVKPVIGYFSDKQKQNAQEADAALKIRGAQVDADLKRIAAGQQAVYDWNLKSLDVSPWRSEYLTVILSMPLVACFIKPLVPYIAAGFKVLENTPLWYRAMVMTMVASAFGYQKLMDYIDKTGDSGSAVSTVEAVASKLATVIP